MTESGTQGRVSCLDAACGTGEGTYDLALLLLEAGCAPEKIEVHGVTIAPLEVFTAAHGYFPHDPVREMAFRSRIGRLFDEGVASSMVFKREDLTDKDCHEAEKYRIVLCNGLLGGPFLNDREEVTRAVAGLCARVMPGGILLATDRFHPGWKRVMPDDVIRAIVAGNGLKLLSIGEGIAGVKQ